MLVALFYVIVWLQARRWAVRLAASAACSWRTAQSACLPSQLLGLAGAATEALRH